MMKFHVYLYMFVCFLSLISLLCRYDMTRIKGITIWVTSDGIVQFLMRVEAVE